MSEEQPSSPPPPRRDSKSSSIGHQRKKVKFARAAADAYRMNAEGDTLLIQAVRKRHRNRVKRLLHAKANVDMVNLDGDTALLVATQEQDLDLMTKLIEAKATIDKANTKNGRTPLLLALTGNNSLSTKKLLEAKANPDQISAYQLYSFAKSGWFGVLTELAKAKANFNTRDSCHGYSPLIIAIMSEEFVAAKILLMAKADPNYPNVSIGGGAEERYPLTWAMRYGYNDPLKILLKAKADPNKGYADDNNPEAVPLCNIAKWRSNDKVAAEGVVALLDAKATINKLDTDGTSPLTHASSQGHIETVKTLLAANARLAIDERNKKGETALHAAVMRFKNEVMKELLAAKANVNIKNNEDDTPLLLAVKNHHPDKVRLLLNAQADPCISNKKGETALELAKRNPVMQKYFQILPFLAGAHARAGARSSLSIIMSRSIFDRAVLGGILAMAGTGGRPFYPTPSAETSESMDVEKDQATASSAQKPGQ